MHFPVDHPLRGFYRGLALLTAAALVGFGVLGFVRTSDLELFDQEGERVLGLTTNGAFSILMILLGLVVAGVTLLGRNLDVMGNAAVGGFLLLLGLVGLCLIRTDLNVLAFSVTNVNVAFVVGLLLLTAGLYASVSRSHHRQTSGH